MVFANDPHITPRVLISRYANENRLRQYVQRWFTWLHSGLRNRVVTKMALTGYGYLSYSTYIKLTPTAFHINSQRLLWVWGASIRDIGPYDFLPWRYGRESLKKSNCVFCLYYFVLPEKFCVFGFLFWVLLRWILIFNLWSQLPYIGALTRRASPNNVVGQVSPAVNEQGSLTEKKRRFMGLEWSQVWNAEVYVCGL